jgi:hypothetical protein
MEPDHGSTASKALRINVDAQKFGTLAEIGGGQEVARWFFHVGRAAATIAKSISAYDVSISDGLYGPTDIYVSRKRLGSMLDHEYDQLIERLDAKRGDKTGFFVFADTVAMRSQSQKREGHGWLGTRFQPQPRSQPSEIIIHVNLKDQESPREQEALGVLGVNLIYGAFYHHQEPGVLITTLMDELSRYRIEVDMVEFSGPAFAGVDNRLMSLQLVEQGLSDAAMFTADGSVVQPAEVLYHKPVLIERGSFRPVTNVTLGMIEQALAQIRKSPDLKSEEVVVLMEMTLSNLTTGRVIDHHDFLASADILGALGKTVLISNYTTFDRVTSYLRRYTQNWIAMVLGLPTLREVFDEKYYTDLDGGILEGLGRLFRGPVKLYVYPARESDSADLSTAATLEVDPKLRHLYAYLFENGFIVPTDAVDAGQLHVTPAEVLAKIQSGDPAWEQMVPPQVVSLIKERKFLGYGEAKT